MIKKLGITLPKTSKTSLEDLVPKASSDAIDMMEKMMSLVPSHRPKAADLLNHKYFDGFKPPNEESQHHGSPIKMSPLKR